MQQEVAPEVLAAIGAAVRIATGKRGRIRRIQRQQIAINNPAHTPPPEVMVAIMAVVQALFPAETGRGVRIRRIRYRGEHAEIMWSKQGRFRMMLLREVRRKYDRY
jgi:hypothetical protein